MRKTKCSLIDAMNYRLIIIFRNYMNTTPDIQSLSHWGLFACEPKFIQRGKDEGILAFARYPILIFRPLKYDEV